jgi:hypothetical protein
MTVLKRLLAMLGTLSVAADWKSNPEQWGRLLLVDAALDASAKPGEG